MLTNLKGFGTTYIYHKYLDKLGRFLWKLYQARSLVVLIEMDIWIVLIIVSTSALISSNWTLGHENFCRTFLNCGNPGNSGNPDSFSNSGNPSNPGELSNSSNPGKP